MDVLVLRSVGRRAYWLVNRWYVGTDSLPTEIARSLVGLDRSPMRRDEGSYVVRLSTPISKPASDDAALRAGQERLDSFARSLGGVLERLRQRPG